jgi:hypothetical protein
MSEIRRHRRRSVARQFDAKATAELLDRSLTHRVRDGARPVDVGEHRTHQHDLSAATDHGFQRGRHRVDDSIDVDGHDTTHLVGRQCAECAAPPEDSGVGDDDVDSRELLEGPPHGFPHGVDVGYVALQRSGMASRECLCNTLRCGQVDITTRAPR